MQTSSFQSMPCVSEDVARAQVAAALTQLAGEKTTIRLMNIEIKQSDGMYIAVATYEIIEAPQEAKDDDDRERAENSRKQEDGNEDDRDTEGLVMYSGAGVVQAAPDISNGELPPEQTEPAAFEPTGQSNLVAAPEPELKPESVAAPSVAPDAEVLAEKVKDDFREAKNPVYNVEESELIAERVAAATEGLNEEEMAALKAEIEKKLAEGLPPDAIFPDTAQKPAAST